MREIKFRAWDKRSETWLYGGIPANVSFWEMLHVDPDNYELAQFTGLLDKNSKEIYEGDIVKYKTPEGKTMVVKYPDCFDSEADGSLYVPANWEVIGNVYENPELK